MSLEKGALVDVEVPIGDADAEMAERVGCDVDAAGKKTVALHRRERSIVPDDVRDRSAIVGTPPPGASYASDKRPQAETYGCS